MLERIKIKIRMRVQLSHYVASNAKPLHRFQISGLVEVVVVWFFY
jgi:hypothetical protein